MGIFDRFATLLKSNINDLISRAEDPEKMLTQILVDMRSQLAKAKQQVATAIADEKRLKDQAEAEFKQARDWENKAMLALKENREDLARQAVMRQNEVRDRIRAIHMDMGRGSAEEMRDVLFGDIEKWGRVVAERHLELDEN